MSKVVEVDTIAELNDVLLNNKAVIVDFAAESWCVPCQRLKPIYESASDMVNATLVHIDIETATDRADFMTEYDIMGVPTVLGFSHGVKVKTFDARTELGGVPLLRGIREVENA